MAKLLYIEASPRKDRSASIKVASAFVDSYEKSHSGDTVEVLDLQQKSLPPFNGDIINAKYRLLHGESHTASEKEAWRVVEDIIGHFKSFDKYLF
jgi:FMN-dependent NADH-azoreductase